MIKPITKDDLHECLNIIHKGFETVAIEFGLTEENCPTEEEQVCLMKSCWMSLKAEF